MARDLNRTVNEEEKGAERSPSAGMNLTIVIQVLQVSVAPVVLISGVGLVILSLSNRMGQLLVRVRHLTDEHESTGDPKVQKQISLLYKRARTIRFSIACLVGCILSDTLVIVAIFWSRLLGLESGLVVALLFGLALAFLTAGLIAFLVDVNQNLHAVQIEIGVGRERRSALSLSAPHDRAQEGSQEGSQPPPS